MIFNANYEFREAIKYSEPINYLRNLYRREPMKFLYLFEVYKDTLGFLRKIGVNREQALGMIDKISLKSLLLKQMSIKDDISWKDEESEYFDQVVDANGMVMIGDFMEIMKARSELGEIGFVKMILEKHESDSLDEFEEKSDSIFKKSRVQRKAKTH